MAKSPRRSANSSKPKRRPAGHAGRRISVMISSGASAVVSAPRKKSLAAITRAPARPVAAIADLVVRDVPHGCDQQRMRAPEARMIQDVAPAHHGAEPHAGVGDVDAV